MSVVMLVRAGGIAEPNYGCGLTDIGCHISESTARIMVSMVTGMGNFIADMFVNAFKDSKIADASWKVMGGEFWFWAGIMAAFVAAIMVWQVSVGAVLRDHKRMVQATLGGLISIPFSVFSVRWMMTLTGAADKAAVYATDTLQHETLAASLLRVVGLSDPKSTSVGLTSSAFREKSMLAQLSADQATDAAANLGQLIVVALIVALMALASGILYLLMETRNMGLLALGALAPVALMFIGQPVLVTWAKRWGSLAVGLIMAKPLAAGVLVLLVKLTGVAPGVGPLLVFAGGVVLAAFSPFWAVKLVNFAGDELGGAVSRRISVTQQINKAQTIAGLGRGFRK